MAEQDWGNAVVVDPRVLERLTEENTRLERSCRRQRSALNVFGIGCVLAAVALYEQTTRVEHMVETARLCEKTVVHANAVLGALARSHDQILNATTKAPSVGTKSWGRRFVVTKYLPHSEAYGRFNTGFTSTLMKADPKSRIVAVDPKLIPYGSSVWVEGLGWFQAQDCGSAIKGFRLDLLTDTEHDAMNFGQHARCAIVVPAELGEPTRGRVSPLRRELAEYYPRHLGGAAGGGDFEPADRGVGEEAEAPEREGVGFGAHHVREAC